MTDARDAIVQQYHTCICASPVDVIALQLPKLRRDLHIAHGTLEACAEADCRICAPHTDATLSKLRGYITRMYRLMTGNDACSATWADTEHTAHFRSNMWALDHDRAMKVSAQVLRPGNTVGVREQMERLRALAVLCDSVHSEEHIAAATQYRVVVDALDKTRRAEANAPATESKHEAKADLIRIRATLRTEWEAVQSTLDPKRMDDLLYCATVFGLGADDAFAPLRTDWWRASYIPEQIVPGIDKACNHIDITDSEVWLRVPVCSKEPQNSVELNVSIESPLLADVLRAFKDTAMTSNSGFLFKPCGMPARKSRRPRAMIKLLRPAGPCPHENQCTRCCETFCSGKNGRRLRECTDGEKRARPECGSYCGAACGHYTNIGGRHKRVCSELGNVTEREELAANMGTTKRQMERYGNGSGSVV